MTLTLQQIITDSDEISGEPFEAARHIWGAECVCWVRLECRSRIVLSLPDNIDGIVIGEECTGDWIDGLVEVAEALGYLVIDHREEEAAGFALVS